MTGKLSPTKQRRSSSGGYPKRRKRMDIDLRKIIYYPLALTLSSSRTVLDLEVRNYTNRVDYGISIAQSADGTVYVYSEGDQKPPLLLVPFASLQRSMDYPLMNAEPKENSRKTARTKGLPAWMPCCGLCGSLRPRGGPLADAVFLHIVRHKKICYTERNPGMTAGRTAHLPFHTFSIKGECPFRQTRAGRRIP